jgi:glyoxalase family protein
MRSIEGIHHITAMASDPQANVDFYHNLLGQRLVKTTVNFDDPGTYHLYYGDEVGSPGTIMTFFPWMGAHRGRRGSGEIGAVAYAIRGESLAFWRAYLERNGVDVEDGAERFGQPVLTFSDPDGMPLELIVDDAAGAIRTWPDGSIPEEHALRGFHGVTLWIADGAATGDLLTSTMRYHLIGQEDDRWRFQGAGAVGSCVDLLVRPDLPDGAIGAGSVHHVAFRAQDDAEQLEYQHAIARTGLGVTPVRDRQYFHSIYFREPGGVLFEIATDGPGFLVDEPVERLGLSLKLPPWLEPQRAMIEGILPPLAVKPIDQETRHA